MVQIETVYGNSTLAIGKAYVSYIMLFVILLSLTSCTKAVRPERGTWHVLEYGETIELLSRRYSVPISDIMNANDIYDQEDLSAGMRLYIPTPIRIQPEAPKAKPRPEPNYKPAPKQRKARFAWPSQGTISSGYGMRHGRMHEGIDITRDKGRDIRAAGSGIVEFAGYRKGYGKTIVINHGRGYKTLYAHNQKLYVKKGRKVRTGTIISRMGSSGRSSGIHLHFEVLYKGKPRNPLRYLPVR